MGALGALLSRSGSPWVSAAGHGVDEPAHISVTVVDAVLTSSPSVVMQLTIAVGAPFEVIMPVRNGEATKLSFVPSGVQISPPARDVVAGRVSRDGIY